MRNRSRTSNLPFSVFAIPLQVGTCDGPLRDRSVWEAVRRRDVEVPVDFEPTRPCRSPRPVPLSIDAVPSGAVAPLGVIAVLLSSPQRWRFHGHVRCLPATTVLLLFSRLGVQHVGCKLSSVSARSWPDSVGCSFECPHQLFVNFGRQWQSLPLMLYVLRRGLLCSQLLIGRENKTCECVRVKLRNRASVSS